MGHKENCEFVKHNAFENMPEQVLSETVGRGLSNNQDIELKQQLHEETEDEVLKCKKCGNDILYGEMFCSKCGKKNKLIRQKTKSDKKIIKNFFKVAMIVAILVVIILGALFCYTQYCDKQNSYDITTLPYSFGDDSTLYAYEIENSKGDKLSDILYLKNNYFMRVLIYGDVVYVSDRGVYETNDKTIITQNDKGEEQEYFIESGCLIEDGYTYTCDEVPKKDLFSLKAYKDYLDVMTTVKFYSDGTYKLKNLTGEYNGVYTREDCVINGVCEDITGSCKWLVYSGKLVDRFMIANGASYEHKQRAEYEFDKYIISVNGYEGLDRYRAEKFIEEYEKTHPISLNK